MRTHHFHVETGLAGYGPDAADRDGFDAYLTVDEAAGGVRDELRTAVDMLADAAPGYAESGDFESAWNATRLADSLDVVCANLDPARANAPLYTEHPGRWQETLQRLLIDADRTALDVEANTLLYIWPCESPECSLQIALDRDTYYGADVVQAARTLLDGKTVDDVSGYYVLALVDVCVTTLDPLGNVTDDDRARIREMITAGMPRPVSRPLDPPHPAWCVCGHEGCPNANLPADWPVKMLGPDDPATDRVTCGACGRSWDDAVSTSMTPAPSARCPFEAFHAE